MAGGRRKKVQPKSQSNKSVCGGLPQSRQYGRKNKEADGDEKANKIRARRPLRPFAELFIGAKENNPDLFDDIFSNEKQEQTRPPAARLPLAPLAVSGIHSQSNSLSSFSSDTFDRIFSKNRNTAAACNLVPAAVSSVASDSSSQSDLASLHLPGPLYASLADCEDLYNTVDTTPPREPFQHPAGPAASTKARHDNRDVGHKTSNFPSSKEKKPDCKNSRSAAGFKNEREFNHFKTLSPAPKSSALNSKTPEVRTRFRRRQRPLLTPRKTPTAASSQLTGKLATMRSRRRRAAETRVPERGNRDSVALSFMVMRTRQNSPNRLSESLVDNEAPHVDKENDGCRIDEPSLLERMSVAASNARSPVTSDTRGALPRHQSVAPGLRRSVGVAAERLTSTPSHHSSSRARRRGLHGSVTPLVAGLHSRLDKLSPVLREDCSHDVVLGPSSLFETPDSDDVFNDDVLTPSSCTKKVHKPDVPALKLCSSPPSVASDYDTARSSRFSFAQHIGASKYQCPEDVRDVASDSATRELKVVVSPLKNAERYSESNSAVLNVSDTSEAISVVMRPLRRRRNPSIRVHAKFPSKSATTRSSGQSSKNVDDGKSLVVDYPVKFLEQDLLKSSFFCEALRCSVVPSPVLTRRQRKVRQSRVPSLDSDASIVMVNKRRKRKDIRSLIPAELLLKPTPLLGSSSEEQNVEGDCKTKENVVTAIDGATKKDAITKKDETKDESEIKSRLESETCDDVELSFSGDDRNQISEISQNLNLNEIRNNCEEDKEGVQINQSGHGSVPEEQRSPSDSCESTSCIEKSSSHQSSSVVEEAGGETEVSAVADLAAPNVLQVPLKRGKGWRRSLSAQARLSTCALRASSVGGGRQADLRRGNTELSYRRSSARVSRDAGGCERASMAALLGRPSRGSKVPPSPLVEVSFSPVDEGWKKEKKEPAEEESQKKNRNGATGGSESKDAIIEGEGCITEDEENGNKQVLKEENDGVVNEERTLDNNISKEKARERILQLCGQEEILQLAECFSEDQLGDCKKIGEGAYGEVFMSDVDGQKKVFKFMPIEGDLKINDEVQKTFAEIHSEIIISMTLSALRAEGEEGGRCSSFVHVLRCWCVRGAYTDHLLSLWDAFHAQKESENDRPDVYGRDQLHIVLEFAPAGQDLECYVFADACQALALFWQVTLGLAVAEEALEFEHRDLHFGNVLVAPTDDISCVYTLDGQQIILPTQGVRATIIDFTMSRLRCADSSVVYSDLSKEPEIFTGSGDYQFDIYRLMRDVLGDDWEKFDPRTNVLWLHYLLDKLITACYYKTKTTSQHRTYISKLQKLKDNVLQYQSARHFVTAYDDDKF